MDTSTLTHANRTEYVRLIVKLLHDKYMVSNSDFARAMGLHPTYIREFRLGIRDRIKPKTLEKIESFVFDLYEPIILEEDKINSFFIQELRRKSFEEKIKTRAEGKK